MTQTDSNYKLSVRRLPTLNTVSPKNIAYFPNSRRCTRAPPASRMPRCRRKNPKIPQMHVHYFKLSDGWRGRRRSLFVRENLVGLMRETVARCKRIRELVREWAGPELDA